MVAKSAKQPGEPSPKDEHDEPGGGQVSSEANEPFRCPHCQALVLPVQILPGPRRLCPACQMPLDRTHLA